MTPFEYTVVSLFLLIAVLDMRKVTVEPVTSMPRWYIYTVVVTAFATAASLFNLAINGVFR